MRTTLAIDDDVLAAAKLLSEQQRKSIGEIVSELARRSLTRPVSRGERNGLPVLPVRDARTAVTPEVVNALRDEVP